MNIIISTLINEQDTHKRFEIDEATGYGHGLDVLIISHQLFVSYPKKDAGGKRNHLNNTHTYLTRGFMFHPLDVIA